MTTPVIFRRNNFFILLKLLSIDEGVIYATSLTDPRNSVFQETYSKPKN